MAQAEESKIHQIYTSILLFAVTLWEIYLAFRAYRNGEALSQFIGTLGVQAPVFTRWFLSTYQFWVVFPLLSTVVAVFVIRRRSISLKLCVTIVALSLFVALLLDAWLNEAFFVPLLKIMNAVQ